MGKSSLLLFFCLTGTLVSQVRPPDPEYYSNTRERFNAYVFRTYTDPLKFGWLLVDSAQETMLESPHQWGRTQESYYCRVASGWGRRIVRNTAQFGFETILHEDSRYRPSGARDFRSRFLFAVRQSVIAYKPDGSLSPAYGRMAAGVVGAAASSTWHPQAIDTGTLLGGVGQAAMDRASSNLITEFTPELKAFGRRTWNLLRTK